MRWAEIQVETTAAAQEAVADAMIANGCAGAVFQGKAPATVKCYLPVDDRLEPKLFAMQSAIKELPSFGIDTGPAEFTVKYVEEQDWAEAWKQYFHTAHIGKRIVIKPPWEEYEPSSRREVVIELEPGMAFGTGTHPTTRMSLVALEKYVKPRVKVVDFGTGSGILAIAAAKMGASIVIALDSDDIAVKATRDNVRRNDQEERIEVHWSDKLGFIGTGWADIVTANIVAATIIANAESLASVLRTGGILIASGIVDDKALDVEQALRNEGFDISETLREGEWVTIVARKAG